MEKSRTEIREEIIREFRENERKWEKAKQELEHDPIWQEMQKWTYIDWNDGREAVLKNGVTVTDIFGTEEWSLEAQDHCFIRNFPTVTVKNAHLSDCVFVECGQITIEEGTATRCVFANVATLFLDDVKVYDSDFRDLQCDHGEFIISMEDSTVSGCRFNEVHLTNGTYLADGVGDCLVEKSSFKNVSTDREDRTIFICEESKGKIIRRKRKYDMVDRASCTGLEFITDQFGAIVIGSFELCDSEGD